MEELTVSTWLWGTKYDHSDVAKLHNGLKRHLRQPFRFVLFSDFALPVYLPVERFPIVDYELTHIPGCFARLRMFDPTFQATHKITGRLVCIDLDTVITGNLDPLFDRPEPFVILQGANAVNPCPYTGALMMVRTGAYPELWRDFNIATVGSLIEWYEFPDDQGWIHYKVPDAAGWKAGENGVYAFQKPGWPMGLMGQFLPHDARLVTFPGARSPKKFRELDWVKRNWVA